MKRAIAALAAVVSAWLGGAAVAKPAEFAVTAFTCPLGGKAFRQEVGYSAFPLYTLPDGSWLGDFQINVQIPVCPDNGLVLIPDFEAKDSSAQDRLTYTAYSADELARLPALIADPAYAALKADGAYAQAAWLAQQLDRPPLTQLALLQRATWGAIDSQVRRRTVARFADAAPAQIERIGSGDDLARRWGLVWRTYRINALRELGRLDEARAALDQLAADAPKLRQAQDPDSIFDAGGFAAPMREAIDAGDTDRFPAGLLPSRIRGSLCRGEPVMPEQTISSHAKAWCAAEAKRQADHEEAMQESFRLSEDKAALDRSCAATPADKRGAGLAQACEFRQFTLDRIEGDRLAQDGPALARACDETPEDKRSGALRSACIAHNSALESALGAAMARDEIAFKLMCPPTQYGRFPDQARYLTGACSSAWTDRDRLAEERLLADPMKLDALCKTKYQDERAVIYGACLERKSQLEAEAIEQLSVDRAAFDRRCGGYGRTNGTGNEVSTRTDEQDLCRRAWRLRENTAARQAAEAKGLKCFHDVIYSPDRPRCVSPAQYAKAMAPSDETITATTNVFEEGSSLSQAAREQAARIVAQAKASGTYPRRRPEETEPFE